MAAPPQFFVNSIFYTGAEGIKAAATLKASTYFIPEVSEWREICLQVFLAASYRPDRASSERLDVRGPLPPPTCQHTPLIFGSPAFRQYLSDGQVTRIAEVLVGPRAEL